MPYPPLHQTQWLASKSIATIGTVPVAGREEAKTTIFLSRKTPHPLPEHLIMLRPSDFPPKITSLHVRHTASQDTTGFLRFSRDVVGKRELRVLRRVSGGGLLHWWLSLPPPIRGKAAATPPVDAIQDRFSARTACQPSLQLSTVSSSSSMLCFSHSQRVFLRRFKVDLSDSLSTPSKTVLSLAPSLQLSSFLFLKTVHISQIFPSAGVFLRSYKVYLSYYLKRISQILSLKPPPANNLPPGTSSIHLAGPSCFSRF